jgi:hypothetical protein
MAGGDGLVDDRLRIRRANAGKLEWFDRLAPRQWNYRLHRKKEKCCFWSKQLLDFGIFELVKCGDAGHGLSIQFAYRAFPPNDHWA